MKRIDLIFLTVFVLTGCKIGEEPKKVESEKGNEKQRYIQEMEGNNSFYLDNESVERWETKELKTMRGARFLLKFNHEMFVEMPDYSQLKVFAGDYSLAQIEVNCSDNVVRFKDVKYVRVNQGTQKIFYSWSDKDWRDLDDNKFLRFLCEK